MPHRTMRFSMEINVQVFRDLTRSIGFPICRHSLLRNLVLELSLNSRKVAGSASRGSTRYSLQIAGTKLFCRVCRFFSFNQQTPNIDDDPPLLEEGAADDVDIIIRPSSSRSINSASGNNILNSNLSGSFREENEMADDAAIAERSPRKGRQHRSAPDILAFDQPSTSYNVPSSSGDRVGVAAIPNNQFDPRSGRSNNFI